MGHADGARGRRRGRLALDGGLVLAAVLVHRCDLRDGGEGERQREPLGEGEGAGGVGRLDRYLSPVFPQIAGLLDRGQISASDQRFQPVSMAT